MPYDAIVVGVGAFGASACYHMASRGMRVLGLDRHSIPNEWGSSYGDVRVFRLCYYEAPEYVPLLKRARELWLELGVRADRPILHEVGGIFAGPAGGPFVAESRRAAVVHGLDHEFLDHEQLAGRYPMVHVPTTHAGLHEPTAGYIPPHVTIREHARLAMQHGAEIHGHEAVQRWASDGTSVRVETDRGATYEAAHLIFAAGPWTTSLLGDLGVELTVSRQVSGWVWPRKPELFTEAELGVWAFENPDQSLLYGLPIHSGALGVKAARHAPGPTLSGMSQYDRSLRDGDEAEFREPLGRYMPEAAGTTLKMQTCTYTNTPDSHFIVDRHPGKSNVIVLAGFSGHGFKFASVIGEVVSDWASQGRTEHPVGFLGLKRFGV